MCRFALIVAIAAGCNLSSSDRAPPGGGGGSSGGSETDPGTGDAGTDGLDAEALRGTLCRLADLRFVETCTPTDLSGVDIAIRGSDVTAVASSDGRFAIADPGGAVVFEIGFDTPDIRDAVVEIPAPVDGQRRPVVVPVVLQADWDTLIDALQIVEPDGTGTAAVYARDDGAPVAGVEVVAPAGSLAAYYDAGSALEWSQLGLTGNGGAALIFAVNDTGRADLSLIDPAGPAIDLSIPVEENALTFAVAEL